MNQKLKTVFYKAGNNIFGKMSRYMFKCRVNINSPVYKPGEYNNYMVDSLSKEISTSILKFLKVDKVEDIKDERIYSINVIITNEEQLQSLFEAAIVLTPIEVINEIKKKNETN